MVVWCGVRFTSLAAFVPHGNPYGTPGRSTCSKLGYIMSPCATFGVVSHYSTVDRYFFGFGRSLTRKLPFNMIMMSISLWIPSGSTLNTFYRCSCSCWSPYFLYCSEASGSFGHRVGYGERNLWMITLCAIWSLFRSTLTRSTLYPTSSCPYSVCWQGRTFGLFCRRQIAQWWTTLFGFIFVTADYTPCGLCAGSFADWSIPCRIAVLFPTLQSSPTNRTFTT
jgi:hypothetical protein